MNEREERNRRIRTEPSVALVKGLNTVHREYREKRGHFYTATLLPVAY